MYKQLQFAFLLAFLLVETGTLFGQNFTFEASTVPSEWSATNGSLSINAEHYKEGSSSLRWQTSGNSSQMSVTFAYDAWAKTDCIYFQLYSPSITNDLLTVDFLNQYGVSIRSMKLRINFMGWREVCRYYNEFLDATNFSVSKVRFTLSPQNTNSRTLYLDDVRLTAQKPNKRIIGTHWVDDQAFFPDANKENLKYYNYVKDIPLATPTTKELAGLSALRANGTIHPSGPSAGNASEIASATTYANSLNIKINGDGSVKGNPVNLRTDDLSDALMLTLTRHLEVLAAESTTQTLFNNLLNHLLDQGFAEGITFNIVSSAYTGAREIPGRLFKLLPKCNATQKEEVLKLCKWIVQEGVLYTPEDIYIKDLNSDQLYIYSFHFMRCVLMESSNDVAVRGLKAFKRYYERCFEYSPRDLDMLKPDGTGFHHGTHYNNYMYAYNTAASFLTYLNGTPFQVEKAAYDRFRKAIISHSLMLSRSTEDNRYQPYSLSGRNPTSLRSSIGKETFENLIIAGDNIYGGVDNEARAAYNYFFMTAKYPVTATDYSGFHAFNYSPMGIYRGEGWTVTMRSPTSKFWGAEIYSGSNRFGRYQANGSLEVMYDGDLSNSGYTTNYSGGGWDWNMYPGTTTVHFPEWKPLMPNSNTSDRFDQYAVTKNYTGALAWGKVGVFTADFDQIEKWGSDRYPANYKTNLTYKKTILAADNLLINIGSNIGTSGSYRSDMKTATNLFQNIIGSGSQPLYLNGLPISSTHNQVIPTGSLTCLLNTVKTGYILPSENDPLHIIYGRQSSPMHTGTDVDSPTQTTLTATKAYLNHGIKTTEKGYRMVVVPNTTVGTLNQIAQQIENGLLYDIISQTNKLHQILYKPQNLMAYSCFEAQTAIDKGLLKATTAEGLLMYKPNPRYIQAYDFAVANPNLRPTESSLFGWEEHPTIMEITLVGKWEMTEGEGITLLSASSSETRIRINLEKGMPRYFTVHDGQPLSEASIPKSSSPQVSYLSATNQLRISLDPEGSTNITVELYQASGTKLFEQTYTSSGSELLIPNPIRNSGIYFVRIQTDNTEKPPSSHKIKIR